MRRPILSRACFASLALALGLLIPIGLLASAVARAATAPTIAPATPRVPTDNTTTSNVTVTPGAPPVPFTKTVAADNAWRELQAALAAAPAFATKLPPGAVVPRKTPAVVTAERAAAAARFSAAALQARNFYLLHPADANAAPARKLEVTAALESARHGNAAAEAPALALAADYRRDKNQLREDRFEVALAADRLRIKKGGGLATVREKPQEHEKLADDLRQEFGAIPEVFGLYAGLAAEADLESGNRIATKLLEMRPPQFAKEAAQLVTSRYGLVGRPLGLRLTSLEGQLFELPASPAIATPTVLYVWTRSPSPGTNPFAALASQKARLTGTTANVRWIYLGLAATAAEAAAAKAKAPFAGTHCVDDAGPRSALAQRLKVRTSPTVFVLNANGVLTGIGHVDELPALLAAAGR